MVYTYKLKSQAGIALETMATKYVGEEENQSLKEYHKS